MGRTKKEAFWKNVKKAYHWAVKLNHAFKISMVASIVFLSLKSFVLSTEVQEQNNKIQSMQEELATQDLLINHLIQNNVSRNRNFNDLKVPFWIKAKQDNEFIMIFVNKFFEDNFLKPKGLTKFDYIGRTDYIAFGPEFAPIYKKSDSITASMSEPRLFIEPFINKDGDSGDMKSIKWREVTVNDTLIYGIGIMF